MSLLKLRPGRENPYAVYDQLRAAGPLVPTRQGNWACTSYRGCDAVLRDRRFGRHPAEDRPGMSFLSMNPPDHTRLRRLALPAFTPRAVARYTARMERTAGELLDAATAAGRFDLVPASPRRCRSSSSPTCSASPIPARRTSPGTAGSSAARSTG